MDKGDYPVYDASGIALTIAKYDFKGEYVAIIKDGSGVGRLQLCSAKSSIIGTLGAILPVNCSASYLLAVMQMIDFKKYVTGATIPHVYYKDYKNAVIPFANEEQQKHIKEIYDNLVRRNNLENTRLDALYSLKAELLKQLFI